MANAKYDNLTVLMTSGWFSWATDAINAYLFMDAVYDAADVNLSDVGGTIMATVPVPNRSVSPEGALLGWPVTFTGIPKDEEFQVILARVSGIPDEQPQVLAFYDVDAEDEPLSLKNNGSLLVRPELVEDPELPPQVGVWVAI